MSLLPELIDENKLFEMQRAGYSRDEFGPGANKPYLCLDLTKIQETYLSITADWLQSLPCPIIGVGENTSITRSACDTILQTDKNIKPIISNLEHAPLAALALVQHMRASEKLSMSSALIAESFAYGTVQQGKDFRNWLTTRKEFDLPNPTHASLVTVDLNASTLTLTLMSGDGRNEIGVEMRDALCQALDIAIIDETISLIKIKSAGRCFSIGGAVSEFGQASDPSSAHWVRSLRLPATRLAQLRKKLEIHVNGAAIGAGAEIAAFGNKITATPSAWFQLPELKYGLIPGAGGTVSIKNRIGRHRTTYMALSMARISARQALDWGLVDAISS